VSAPVPVRALQVVTLRMLHDAAFREAVYRDPAAALADSGLPDGAAAWFTAPDARAWDVDPMRNARLLTSILEEYPATAFALASAGWRLPRLHAFFGSRAFSDGLSAWETLAASFGAWLTQGDTPRAARALARLERAIAACRRATGPRPGAGMVGPAPGTAVLTCPEGTLGRYGNILGWLARQREAGGAAAVVARALSQGPPRGGPALTGAGSAEIEGLAIVTQAGAEPRVREVGEGVVSLVGWLGAGQPHAGAVAWLAAEGLAQEEAGELLAELIAEGVLTVG
jgi:hypothetical protein